MYRVERTQSVGFGVDAVETIEHCNLDSLDEANLLVNSLRSLEIRMGGKLLDSGDVVFSSPGYYHAVSFAIKTL